MSLASLNSSGVQQSNPALYQTIKDLLDDHAQLNNLLVSYGFSVNKSIKQLTLSNSLNLLLGQIQFPIVRNLSINPNTLDTYEEGSYTPTDGSGAGLVFTSSGLTYTRIGSLVALQGQLVYPVTANVSPAIINLLPFINIAGNGALELGYYTGPNPARIWVQGGSSVVQIMNGGAAYTNANLSGANIVFSGIYLTP